jgi:hypothetical protein
LKDKYRKIFWNGGVKKSLIPEIQKSEGIRDSDKALWKEAADTLKTETFSEAKNRFFAL